jgi:hypothetical protein
LPDGGASGDNDGMWRILSLVIIGFWLVMTSLLVRFVWFPEGTQFAEVPPSVVLRRYLEQSSAVSSAVSTAGMLYVYRREEKIGFTTIRCTRLRPGGQDFMLRMDGFLDKGAVPFTPEKVTWRLALTLLNVEEFGELKGWVRIERTPWKTDFLWQKGQRVPSISVKAPEEAGINDALIQMMLAQAFAGGGMPGMPAMPGAMAAGAVPAVEPEGVLAIRARESEMKFAGQKSRGHLLEFTILGNWKARAFITEAGEFVLLNLPEGYRLVEPVIHGLVPDYDDEEDEAAAAAKP